MMPAESALHLERQQALPIETLIVLAAFVVILTYFVSYKSSASKARLAIPEGVLSSFQEIAPDRSFETDDLYIMKKERVYILLPKNGFNSVYPIRSISEADIQDRELMLPITSLRKSYSTDKICGLPAARCMGEFTIPVDVSRTSSEAAFRYRKISGNAYMVTGSDVLLHRRFPSKDLSEKLDKTTILVIIGKLFEQGESDRQGKQGEF